MNKLESDPRVTQGAGFFGAVIDWMRRAALAVNALVDGLTGVQSELGTLAPGGIVPVAKGGTGATTAAGARANLGAVNVAGDTIGPLTVRNQIVVGGTNSGKVLYNNGTNAQVADTGVGTLTGFGDSWGLNLSNGTGILAIGTNGTTRIEVQTSGSVRINNALRVQGHQTTASGANCVIDTAGWIYRSTSSLRYKRDVRTLTAEEASVIYRLRPVRYRSVAEADPKDWTFYGFIAEEAADEDPRFVAFRREEDGTLTPDGMQYDRLTVPLVFEMRRLRADLDRALERIAILEGA